MLCSKFDWNLLSGPWEENFFLSLTPLWDGHDNYYEQNWIPFNLVKIGPVFLENKISFLWCLQNVFSTVKQSINQSECFYYFAIIPPFIGTTLNLNWTEFPTCKDECLCQVWPKVTEWFWSKILFKVVNIFSLLSSLENGGENPPESPLPKDELCQV